MHLTQEEAKLAISTLNFLLEELLKVLMMTMVTMKMVMPVKTSLLAVKEQEWERPTIAAVVVASVVSVLVVQDVAWPLQVGLVAAAAGSVSDCSSWLLVEVV